MKTTKNSEKIKRVLFTIDKWKKLAYNKQSKDGGRSRAKREFVEIPVPQPC